MITATISGGDQAAARLARLAPALAEKLRPEVARLTTELADRVRAKMPPGLRGSVRSRVRQTETAIIGTVAVTGAPAAVWDLGYSGEQQVREHLRQAKEAFGKPLAQPRAMLIRAHSRFVERPPHDGLAETAADMAGDIREALADVAGEIGA